MQRDTRAVSLLQMSQFWSLHDSVLRAALWEVRAVQIVASLVWVCCVWSVVLHIKLGAVREARSWIFGEFCTARRLGLLLLLLLGLERRGGRLVITAQMDITQTCQSGAAWGGGGGRGWAGGGGAGYVGEALHSLVLLLLHPPVLKPDLNLPLVEVEQAGHLLPPRPAQVAAEVELLLQLHQLRARVCGARALRGRGRAWALLVAICGDKCREMMCRTDTLHFLPVSLHCVYCQFPVFLIASVA